jgi:hypothetical protein
LWAILELVETKFKAPAETFPAVECYSKTLENLECSSKTGLDE